MKIALVNVKFSPNLGDGLIAECLEWALASRIPDSAFVSVDLAGRTGFASDSGGRRGLALRFLSVLPARLRRVAFSSLIRTLIFTRYRKLWTESLSDCDRLLLGGGQLFADADLNFPLKIKALASIVRERHLPSVVFGVGVSRTWSDAGASLFRKAMDAWAPRFVAARDQESVANWNAHFANTNQVSAQLCRDPGLLAALVYAETGHQSRDRPVIGVGVVHPLTLNLHTHESNLSLSQATELWKLLVIALCKRDMDVALFTNGPADDESFLELIFEALPSDERRRVTRLPRPRLPADLVRSIASCDAIAAHRLHANIVAFACKVGHVGLGWDAKLPAFFKSVGREDFFAGDIQSVAADTIAEKIVLALKMPVPAQVYDTVIEETWSGVNACAAVLSPDKAG